MATASRLPEPPDGFHRELVSEADRFLVRSTCDYCGLMIVGSVTQSLMQDELDHREHCRPVRAPAASVK